LNTGVAAGVAAGAAAGTADTVATVRRILFVCLGNIEDL
jgi:hypothetical protein